jgi:putative transposase
VHIEPFTTLSWAYQLHYYLCFRTHYLRKTFSEDVLRTTLSESISEICGHHQYHELETQVYPDNIRLVISLRPTDVVSDVIRTLKSISARAIGATSGLEPPIWGRGYLAKSVGRARIGPVRKYIEGQSEHHGYAKRKRPPVYRFRVERDIALAPRHAVTKLDHHLVFATKGRVGIFGLEIGKRLCEYWLRVAEKHGFAITRCTFLPDHIHLVVRIPPNMSIEQCALSMLNNGEYFVAGHAGELLVRAGIDRLWQPSAYAGTTGEFTTALTKSILGK